MFLLKSGRDVSGSKKGNKSLILASNFIFDGTVHVVLKRRKELNQHAVLEPRLIGREQ